MERIFRRLEEIINSGDDEIRTWFLVSSNYLPFILCGFYVLFSCWIGPALMKNRKPFDLRIPMVIFNFCIVLTYVISMSTILWNFRNITLKEFCIEASAIKGTSAYTISKYLWVIYILKYVEQFDTIFFVLRKKENLITFLHVFHHTVVPVLFWMAFRTEKSGIQSIPGLLNSFVHVIMYSYYGLAAMGPQVRIYLWWKKYLTQLQMTQFILIFAYVVLLPFSGCTVVRTSYLMGTIFAPLFLYLFYRFYVLVFQQEQKSRVTNGATKKVESRNGMAEREIPASKKGDLEKQHFPNGVSTLTNTVKPRFSANIRSDDSTAL